jgi:hypothetical protein
MDGVPGFGDRDVQPLGPAPNGAPPKLFNNSGPALPRWVPNAPHTGALKQRNPTAPYIFAWGPTAGAAPTQGGAGDYSRVRPSLIRITMDLVDPNGRLPEGQRIELVFPLK